MVALLKTLCGVKVVVLLTSHPDVKDRIFTTMDGYIDEKDRIKELVDADLNIVWSKIFFERDNYVDKKERIKNLTKTDLYNKLSNMLNGFPPNLVNIIPLDLAPCIEREIVRYAKLLESKFGLSQQFSNNFIRYSIFSSNGTIDEELAARDLLKESNLSILVLFNVACYYCLEDITATIWEKHQIFKENFDNFNLIDSEVKWLQYLVEKEKYSKNSSNFEILSRFLFELLSSAIDENNFAAFKYVWKTVEESKEFQNFGEFTGHKCIAVFNKFYNEWFSKFCYNIIKGIQCMTSSSQFYVCGDLLRFIFSRMTIEEIKDFLSSFRARFPITYCILFIFLHWPYCDIFMYLAESLFCILSKNEYYSLMHYIVDLISSNYYDMPDNYRLLLREFWIKSPLRLKKQVITLEQMEIGVTYEPPLYCSESIPSTEKILEKLILHCNFTPDDEYNFLMILEAATQQEKNNIFKFQGKRICDRLISNGDYKLTDFFLQSLNVDDETQQSLKKDLAINNFKEVMKLKSLNLVTQLIKWAVGSGEDKIIKQEIFSMWFEFNKIANLYMSSDIAISFLEEIFKIFLNSDEIEEWKQNRAFDVKFVESMVYKYYKPDRFDQFLKWICYTEEEICETKENLLLIILENGISFYMPKKKFTDMIFYLCSNNRDKISEFGISLLAICETYAEKDTCQHFHNEQYFD